MVENWFSKSKWLTLKKHQQFGSTIYLDFISYFQQIIFCFVIYRKLLLLIRYGTYVTRRKHTCRKIHCNHEIWMKRRRNKVLGTVAALIEQQVHIINRNSCCELSHCPLTTSLFTLIMEVWHTSGSSPFYNCVAYYSPTHVSQRTRIVWERKRSAFTRSINFITPASFTTARHTHHYTAMEAMTLQPGILTITLRWRPL